VAVTRAVTGLRAWLAAWAVAALAGLALAGCGTADDEVASLVGDGSAGMGVDPDVLRQTEDMVACLQDKGLPAAIGVVGVTLETEEPFELCDEFGCRTESRTEAGDAAEPAVFEELRGPYEAAGTSGERLLFRDADYTAAYLACKEKTGYSMAAKAREFAEERLAGALRQAEAGVEWAACARENGYPQVADPETPTLAEVDTAAPAVWLPESMTEAELKSLLAACPVFDRAAWEAADGLLMRQLEAGVPFDRLDWTGWEEPALPYVDFGDPARPFDPDSPDVEERIARLHPLWQMIDADRAAYADERVERFRAFEQN
jgi:hypothetical protein